MRRCTLGLIAATVVLGVPAQAEATWSIVAVDAETQEVGVAVASCVEAPFGTTLLPEVVGLAPGVGALAAQALLSQQYRDEAVALLADGYSPQEVIDMVVAADPGSASRQYGVVTLDGQTATFTGAAANEWAGDLQGDGVTAHGNILYGAEVVGDALTAFEADAPGCPWTLADRLMVALEAGAARGGDNRCSEEQSALAAVLKVAGPGDTKDAPYIDLRIPSEPHGGENPVALLRAAYDAWRLANPPDDAGCIGGTGSTGGTGDEGVGTGSSAGGDTIVTTEGEASTTGGSTSTYSTSAAPTSTPLSDTDAGSPEAGDAGCGCTTTGGAPLSLIVMAALLRRRRRFSACETG